jgi:hypothetical protein
MTPKQLDAAATHLGERALRLIGHILKKHDAAVIEASIEAIQAAVLAERSACADICDQHASVEGIAQRCAAEIRKRSEV